MEESKIEEKKTEEVNNKEDYLKKIEKAAEKGALKGSKKNGLISSAVTIVAIAIVVMMVVGNVNSKIDQIFSVDAPVADHDLTLENNGILGYTCADFAEAILGDGSKLKKLEVYKQEISDAATLTDTGLFNWSVFTKTQVITYNGTVVYTVDLGSLTKNDISLDEENKIITIRIPHAEQEEINIPEDKIQYADPEKGLLAFGNIEATPEQIGEIQKEARNKMQLKLDESDTLATANRFAKLAVWETYSPIIKGVAKEYSLEVVFKD